MVRSCRLRSSPRIDAAHTRQPAWNSHIEALRGAGMHLLMGDEYWPLHEPRSAPGKDLPWSKILDAVERIPGQALHG